MGLFVYRMGSLAIFFSGLKINSHEIFVSYLYLSKQKRIIEIMVIPTILWLLNVWVKDEADDLLKNTVSKIGCLIIRLKNTSLKVLYLYPLAIFIGLKLRHMLRHYCKESLKNH